jgi:hypothetical protein
MIHFTNILVVLNFSNCGFVVFSYTLFTLCPFETKMGSIFCCGPRMYVQTCQVFFVPNGQRGSLLVFYIGNILVDKNTLCNGCFLTGLSVLFRVFK